MLFIFLSVGSSIFLAIAALFAAFSVEDPDVLETGAVGGTEEQPAKTAAKRKALETLKTVLRLEEINLMKLLLTIACKRHDEPPFQ
jgi:hypothetical protein